MDGTTIPDVATAHVVGGRIRCPIRCQYLKATPEELVRQNVLAYCMNQLGWPRQMFWTEYPLSRAKAGKGRADIVLWRPAREGESHPWQFAPGIPFLVIECKAAGVSLLGSNVANQAAKYAVGLKTKYFAVTDQLRWKTYRVGDDCKSGYTELERCPRYNEACDEAGLLINDRAPQELLPNYTWAQLSNPSYVRTEWSRLNTIQWVNNNTPVAYRHVVLNLLGILVGGNPVSTAPGLPWAGYGLTIEEDWGVSGRDFGHSAGSDIGWYFRVFNVRKSDGKDFRLFLTIYDMFGSDSPFWTAADTRNYGNRNGKTHLTVGTESEGSSRISLELNLDKFFIPDAKMDELRIIHDGTMTAKTRLKNQVVLDAVKSRQPALMRGQDSILLGGLSMRRQLEWPDLKDVVLRLAAYADVRDQLRLRIQEGRVAKRQGSIIR
jgi:hypothetical protein